MKKTGFNFDAYGATFLAHDLHKLRVLVSEQSDRVFETAGISFPSHCSSVVLLLEKAGEAPVTSLAEALGYSHQLIIQRLTILEKRALVCRYKDPGDRRRSLVSLTKKGRVEAQKTKKALVAIDKGITSVLDDLGTDLLADLRRARALLAETPLVERCFRAENSPNKARG